MTELDAALADYLKMRRALGYRLARTEKLLTQFLGYLAQVGASWVTTEHALAWASLPSAADPSWWGQRLSAVRGFAAFLHTLDPSSEVPPADVWPQR